MQILQILLIKLILIKRYLILKKIKNRDKQKLVSYKYLLGDKELYIQKTEKLLKMKPDRLRCKVWPILEL